MKSLCTKSGTLALMAGGVASALLLGHPHEAAAASADCPLQPPSPANIEPMTIIFMNNDPDHNIFPVLTTGTSTSNLWLRAYFGISKADAEAAEKAGKPCFPKLNNFRIYIEPVTGIPPGGRVTLTLPFVTKLVAGKPDPKVTDQYIDWWGGGHVEVFAAPKDSGAPPELTAFYQGKEGQTEVDVSSIPARQLPRTKCKPACQDGLKVFKDTKGVFKNNAPFQLTEYTLGVIDQNADPPVLGTHFGAVDIDVSYVDTAYLPAVMAPYDPTAPALNQVGYVGTPLRIKAFRNGLNKFLADYQATKKGFRGWPQFVPDGSNTPLDPPKVAAMLHATAGDPDLTKPPWQPVEDAKAAWIGCVKDTTKKDPICPLMREVHDLFMANWKKYSDLYKTCTKIDPDQKDPVQPTDDLMFGHVQAFTPWIENCANFADKNLLADTPGYEDTKDSHNNIIPGKFREVKLKFDQLQYWPDNSFNPYLALIHGRGATPTTPGTRYINAPNVYAYSVDDAVGNLQADGAGFYLAVGGTRGLPNPNPASPPVHVNFGGASAFGDWTHFGVCTTDIATIKKRPINPNFRSIPFYVQQDKLDQCPISLLAKWSPGGEEVVYSFKLKSLDFTEDLPKPPLNPITQKTHAPISCDGLDPIPRRLCCDIYAYKEANTSASKGPDERHVQVPGVYPHTGEACPPLPPG